MPKRAPTGDTVDPVRSRLAASVASPVAPSSPPNGAAVGGAEAEPQPQAAAEVAQPAPRERAPLTQRPIAPRPSSPKAPDDRDRINKKFLVRQSESDRMDETMDVITQAFGSRVSYSAVSRAMWSVLAMAEEAMAGHPRRGEPLRRPAKGDAVGMAEYEEALCDYLRGVLKRT